MNCKKLSHITDGKDTLRCHNLRHAAGGDALTPVGTPTTIANGKYTLLTTFPHADGSTSLIVHSGTRLVAIFKGEILQLATLPSAPRCATVAGSTLIVMTSQGPFRVDYVDATGSWRVAGLMPDLPPISIVAADTATLSATIPARTLSGSYSHWQGSLAHVDRDNVTADLLDAYDSISASAAEMGYFLQPVLCRYRLKDAAGNTLFLSPPVLVSAPDGFQCVNQVIATTADRLTLDSYNLSLTAYSLGVVAPSLLSSSWGEIITEVVIEASTPLEPVDFSLKISNRLDATGSSSGNIVIFMPGTATTMVPATSKRAALVVSSVQRANNLMSPIARYPRPFTGGISTSPGKILKIVPHSSASTSKIDTPAATLTKFSAPHSFTAGCVSVSGDTIAWGDISALRFNGYPLPVFAASVGEGNWRAATQVTFTDGDEAVVWHSSGSVAAPSLLSPLISYPSADAVEITIIVSSPDGLVMRRSLPLTPSPDGTFAYYLHPSLAPFAIEDEVETYVIPAEKLKTVPHHNHIAITNIRSPLSPTVTAAVTQGVIRALTPAVRSSSSWDFARSHYYAFTSAGIYAVAVNAARDRLSGHIIDPRAVSSASQVTVSGQAVYAIASTDLVAVSGSRAKTIERDTTFETIGWERAYNELWCIPASGDATIYSIDNDYDSYTRDINHPCRLLSCGGTLFLQSGEILFDASAETQPAAINISLTRREAISGLVAPMFYTSHSLPRLSIASFSVFSSSFSGSLIIAAGGTGDYDNARLLTRLDINGSLTAPIPVRIYAPPRPYIFTHISGKVSPDTLIHPAQLLLSSTS